jgi:hypothetical protein
MTLQALPVRVPLVARETLESYLSRLASANHLEPRDLRVHLGMRSPTMPPDLDRLSTLTGNSARRLTGMLADAVPPPGRTRLAPRRGRPACRHCTRRRGIPTDVWCVAVDQRVCLRHRRWLGGLTEEPGDQHDLTPVPEITAAQRRHRRLIRRRGTETGRAAIGDAATIIAGWSEPDQLHERRQCRIDSLLATRSDHTEPLERRVEPSVLAMVDYPEVATLATLLADPHWRSIASADHRADRLPFELEAARRLNLAPIESVVGDRFVPWEEGQALARRSRLNQQPGYRGPEVWLSAL